MDIDGLEQLLQRIESRRVRGGRARPDGALAARARDAEGPALRLPRRRAARGAPHPGGHGRRWLDPETAADLGALDPEAIARVRDEAWPDAANADELHDALVWLGFLTEAEVQPAGHALAGPAGSRRWPREAPARRACSGGSALWIAAERLPQFRALWPEAPPRCRRSPRRRATPSATGRARRRWSRSCAAGSEGLGPVTPSALAAPLGSDAGGDRGRAGGARSRGLRHARALHAGRRRDEWCERRLLARIHRYTLKPAARRDRARRGARLPALPLRLAARRARRAGGGAGALDALLGQLEGFEAPAGAWESEILPARLDRLRARPGSMTLPRRPHAPGRGWRPRNGGRRAAAGAGAHDADRAAARGAMPALGGAVAPADRGSPAPRAQAVVDFMRQHGASFFDELRRGHAACCAPSSRRRWPSWSRSGWSPPTASPACARCWCRRQAPPVAHGRRGAAPRSFGMENAGPLVAGPRRGQPRGRGPSARRRRARRPDAAAPLRRGVLAPARAGGRLAAALARPAARLPPARGARRDPRRAFRRRLLGRAVRACPKRSACCARSAASPRWALDSLSGADPLTSPAS